MEIIQDALVRENISLRTTTVALQNKICISKHRKNLEYNLLAPIAYGW